MGRWLFLTDFLKSRAAQKDPIKKAAMDNVYRKLGREYPDKKKFFTYGDNSTIKLDRDSLEQNYLEAKRLQDRKNKVENFIGPKEPVFHKFRQKQTGGEGSKIRQNYLDDLANEILSKSGDKNLVIDRKGFESRDINEENIGTSLDTYKPLQDLQEDDELYDELITRINKKAPFIKENDPIYGEGSIKTADDIIKAMNAHPIKTTYSTNEGDVVLTKQRNIINKPYGKFVRNTSTGKIHYFPNKTKHFRPVPRLGDLSNLDKKEYDLFLQQFDKDYSFIDPETMSEPDLLEELKNVAKLRREEDKYDPLLQRNSVYSSKR